MLSEMFEFLRIYLIFQGEQGNLSAPTRDGNIAKFLPGPGPARPRPKKRAAARPGPVRPKIM